MWSLISDHWKLILISRWLGLKHPVYCYMNGNINKNIIYRYIYRAIMFLIFGLIYKIINLYMCAACRSHWDIVTTLYSSTLWLCIGDVMFVMLEITNFICNYIAFNSKYLSGNNKKIKSYSGRNRSWCFFVRQLNWAIIDLLIKSIKWFFAWYPIPIFIIFI